MKKILYVSIVALFVISASSCTKQCIQCKASDTAGNKLNESNKVCDYDFQSNLFQERYKKNFKDYVVTCYNVN